MRPKLFAIGAAGLVLLLAGVWYSRPAPELAGSEELAPARSSDDASAVTAHANGSPETTTSVAELDAARAAVLRESPLSPLPGEAPVTPMAQLLEAGQQEFPQPVINNERAFAAEAVDGAWAPGAEARLLDRIAQMSGLQLTGLQVECRSTMCRLQIAFPRQQGATTSGPSGSLFQSLGLKPRWVVAMVDASETPQIVAYLVREGMEPDAQSAASTDGN